MGWDTTGQTSGLSDCRGYGDMSGFELYGENGMLQVSSDTPLVTLIKKVKPEFLWNTAYGNTYRYNETVHTPSDYCIVAVKILGSRFTYAIQAAGFVSGAKMTIDVKVVELPASRQDIDIYIYDVPNTISPIYTGLELYSETTGEITFNSGNKLLNVIGNVSATFVEPIGGPGAQTVNFTVASNDILLSKGVDALYHYYIGPEASYYRIGVYETWWRYTSATNIECRFTSNESYLYPISTGFPLYNWNFRGLFAKVP